MPFLRAPDGTNLAYHVFGAGRPLVCLPGGPMQDSVYLGDLGGLSTQFQLIVLDSRGTGQSQRSTDTASYRCDRLVDDVESLRAHLGVDRMDLLAHSAAANLAALYAVQHPRRVARLVLITPSTFAVGINATKEDRRAVMRLRRDEPWFAPAAKAFEAIQTGHASDGDWEAIAPLTYGRWDAAAQGSSRAGGRTAKRRGGCHLRRRRRLRPAGHSGVARHVRCACPDSRR